MLVLFLAEGLSGSEKLFSEELTELGKEIGLKNSFLQILRAGQTLNI